ncbi:MAG: DEAD/DEAH box helicase [Desulfurococcales archaeon]|nr:DEAD/DEAH box helicase [Desulfurococcales archaeon]
MRPLTRKIMELLGYTSLYPPQKQALDYGIEYGKSLLVATPTASGKTFIAAAAITNALNDNGGIAVYLAPLRSIAMEKYTYFKHLGQLGLKTRILIGDLALGPLDFDVLITTYEKFDAVLRNNPELLDRTSIVVIDEIHYVGDPKRGTTLESIIARILSDKPDIQLIALSATVENVEEIAEWLNTSYMTSDWRPVPLKQAIFKNYNLFYEDGVVEKVDKVTGVEYLDTTIRTIRTGGQVLIFSQSRRRTVALAKRTARHRKHLRYDPILAKKYARKILGTTGPTSVIEELADLMTRGVAYHHAGLSSAQRQIIEEAFREGAIAVIHATPTLAAGVNLPARTVIVEEYYRYEQGLRRPIQVFEYKQLAGRAGRPGYDDVGEAIIIASRNDSVEELSTIYISANPEPVTSKLEGLSGLRHLILGLVSSTGTGTREQLEQYLSKTLFAKQRGLSYLAHLIDKSLRDLQSWNLIDMSCTSNSKCEITATPLGIELSKTYLDPLSIPILRQILSTARRASEDILLYTISAMPDMTTLPVSKREAEKLLDKIIDEAEDLIDIITWFGPQESRSTKIFFVLKAWIDEQSEDYIYKEFGVGSGDLYNIVETAKWIANSIARITRFLPEAHGLEPRYRSLETRIRYGVKPELLPLVIIPGIGRIRARRLYDAGFRNLTDLATAPVEKLLSIKGLGPTVVKDILEFLGRGNEARAIASRSKRSLEDYLK